MGFVSFPMDPIRWIRFDSLGSIVALHRCVALRFIALPSSSRSNKRWVPRRSKPFDQNRRFLLERREEWRRDYCFTWTTQRIIGDEWENKHGIEDSQVFHWKDETRKNHSSIATTKQSHSLRMNWNGLIAPFYKYIYILFEYDVFRRLSCGDCQPDF